MDRRTYTDRNEHFLKFSNQKADETWRGTQGERLRHKRFVGQRKRRARHEAKRPNKISDSMRNSVLFRTLDIFDVQYKDVNLYKILVFFV